MNEQFILKIINQIEPQIYWMFAKMLVAIIILLVLKGFIESLVAYIQFRLNPRLGIGVQIKIRGIKGKIIDYNLNWIFVKTKNDTEIILMKRWKFEKWTLNEES